MRSYNHQLFDITGIISSLNQIVLTQKLLLCMCVCLVAQSCLTLCDPMDLCPWAHQDPLFMGILWTRILEWVAMPSSMASSKTRDGTQVSRLVGRFFTSELKGSPRILEWIAAILPEGIFQTKESKRGLLHCRQILYQLSYRGSLLLWILTHFSILDELSLMNWNGQGLLFFFFQIKLVPSYYYFV